MKHKEKKRLKKLRDKAFEAACKPIIIERKLSKMSLGEQAIANFLIRNGIRFEREHYFKDFYIGGKRKLFFYDFYLPDFNLCIEFDGQQHYSGEWQGKKDGRIKQRDFVKTNFCKKMGIHLLRIKYTNINSIDRLICEKCDKIKPIL